MAVYPRRLPGDGQRQTRTEYEIAVEAERKRCRDIVIATLTGLDGPLEFILHNIDSGRPWPRFDLGPTEDEG